MFVKLKRIVKWRTEIYFSNYHTVVLDVYWNCMNDAIRFENVGIMLRNLQQRIIYLFTTKITSLTSPQQKKETNQNWKRIEKGHPSNWYNKRNSIKTFLCHQRIIKKFDFSKTNYYSNVPKKNKSHRALYKHTETHTRKRKQQQTIRRDIDGRKMCFNSRSTSDQQIETDKKEIMMSFRLLSPLCLSTFQS